MKSTTDALVEALEGFSSIERYGLDTLSGRLDGPDDYAWQRAAVNEMVKRAKVSMWHLRAALALARAEQAEPAVQPDGFSADILRLCSPVDPKDFYGVADAIAQALVEDESSNTPDEGMDPKVRRRLRQALTVAIQWEHTARAEQAEPLTDAQIDDWWRSENGLEDCVMSKQLDFRKVVRAIEAAHGITPKEGG